MGRLNRETLPGTAFGMMLDRFWAGLQNEKKGVGFCLQEKVMYVLGIPAVS